MTGPALAKDLSETRIAAGDLEARLAETAAELDAAQALRYRVFFEEMGATPTPAAKATRRDTDAFDAHCDHLLVLDNRRPGANVIGTYRLMRRSHAAAAGGFYSAGEFDIARILAFPGEILELGRSCVDAGFRTRGTMQLLWRGIAQYVFWHHIDLMFGCASLFGTDASKHVQELAYLYHYHLAPPALRPRALSARAVDMNRLPYDAVDPKVALSALPPLMKGYLRLGGFVGDGAVIDLEFGTTDVSIVVKTDLMTERYYRHYERTARPADDR
jgi:L-ornithine Nalpha-acyltransferase